MQNHKTDCFGLQSEFNYRVFKSENLFKELPYFTSGLILYNRQLNPKKLNLFFHLRIIWELNETN